MRSWATIALAIAMAACAGNHPAPPAKTPSNAASATPPPSPPRIPSSATSGRACPAPVTTPFMVVPQGGIGATAEMQFSKDGRIAAAKTSAIEIQIWSVATGNKIAVVMPGTAIAEWALRPDGRMLAVVSDGHLSLVDPMTRAAPIKVAMPANVERLDWKSDSKLLFATRGQETSVVDIAGNVTATVAAASSPGGISADGRYLFSREGAMWDVATKQQRWKAAGPSASVSFSEDGQSVALAMSGQVQSIVVLDSASGNKRWEVPTRGGLGSEIAISPDGQSVAAYDNGENTERGTEERGMTLWSRGKRTRLWKPAEAIAATRASFSPDGKVVAFMATGESGPEIRLADARTGARTKQPKNGHDVRTEPPRWSADSRTMLQASTNGLVVIDVAKGDRKVIGKTVVETAKASAVTHKDAVWSPDDGAILIIADQGTRSLATVVDLKTGAPGETLEGRSAKGVARQFHTAEWNAATGLIALDRIDGVVIWDGRAKQPLRVIDTGDGEATAHQIAFSPQGHLLATLASPNEEVRLWDPKTGNRVRSLGVAGAKQGGEGGSGAIEGMAFSADGTRIALSAMLTNGVEQSTHIAIYDTATGALIRTLHAQRPYQYNYGASYGRSGTLHFTPQGKGIVWIAGSGRVDLFNTATDDPPTPLLEKAAPGPSTLGDSGNLLLMGSSTVDLWDLRTRTRTRELRGDSPVLSTHLARGGAISVTHPDHVDLFRVSDRASLSIRLTPPSGTPVIVADNGVFAGPPTGASTLRVRDAADSDVRPLRPNEVPTLNRPSLGFDFVMGCPIDGL